MNILTRFLLDAHVQQPDGLFAHARSAPIGDAAMALRRWVSPRR
ncbi:MAG: hypothetical protein R2911_35895 [Caldilineaceae bacterium]